MSDVRQSKTTTAKINERLQNHPSGRTAQATVTTQPTRTVTNVYQSGFQSQRGDQVKQGGDND